MIPDTKIYNNLYWAADRNEGKPDFGYEGPGEDYIIADPQFVNYSGIKKDDFKLKDSSPYKTVGIGAFEE